MENDDDDSNGETLIMDMRVLLGDGANISLVVPELNLRSTRTVLCSSFDK